MTNSKRKYSFIPIALLIVVVLSNTPPAAYFFAPAYSYQTEDGNFTYNEEPGKALDYEVLKIRYARFIQENPHQKNKQLYRTFTIKPWQFWQWWEMIVRSERFRLPYLGS